MRAGTEDLGPVEVPRGAKFATAQLRCPLVEESAGCRPGEGESFGVIDVGEYCLEGRAQADARLKSLGVVTGRVVVALE